MMQRRGFLKLLGLATLGVVVRVPFAALTAGAATRTVSAGGLGYRTDGMGRVFVSRDAGRSWDLHSDLGPSYSITRLEVDKGGRLLSTVDYRGRSFGLVLGANRRSWLTI